MANAQTAVWVAGAPIWANGTTDKAWLVAWTQNATNAGNVAACYYQGGASGGIDGCTSALSLGNDAEWTQVAKIADNLAVLAYVDPASTDDLESVLVYLTDPGTANFTPNLVDAKVVNTDKFDHLHVCTPDGVSNRWALVMDNTLTGVGGRIVVGEATGSGASASHSYGSMGAVNKSSGNHIHVASCEFVAADKIAVFYSDQSGGTNGRAELCTVDWSTKAVSCSRKSEFYGNNLGAAFQGKGGTDTLVFSGFGVSTAVVGTVFVETSGSSGRFLGTQAHVKAGKERQLIDGFETGAIESALWATSASTGASVTIQNVGISPDLDPVAVDNDYSVKVSATTATAAEASLTFDIRDSFETVIHTTLKDTRTGTEATNDDLIVLISNEDDAGNKQCFLVKDPATGNLLLYWDAIVKECNGGWNDGTICTDVDTDCFGELEGFRSCDDASFAQASFLVSGLSTVAKEVVVGQKTGSSSLPGEVTCTLKVDGLDAGSGAKPRGLCSPQPVPDNGSHAGQSMPQACRSAADCDDFDADWTGICDVSALDNLTQKIVLGRESLIPKDAGNPKGAKQDMDLDDVAISTDFGLLETQSRLYVLRSLPGCANDIDDPTPCNQPTPQDFTPIGCTNHDECIDEVPHDSDTTSVDSGISPPKSDTTALADLALGVGETLGAVSLSFVLKQNNSNLDVWKTFTANLIDGSSNEIKSIFVDASENGDPNYFRDGFTVFPTAPDGSAWSANKFNNLELKLTHEVSGNGGKAFITQVLFQHEINRPTKDIKSTLSDQNGDGKITVTTTGDSVFGPAGIYNFLLPLIPQVDALYNCALGGNETMDVLNGVDNVLTSAPAPCFVFKGPTGLPTDYYIPQTTGANDWTMALAEGPNDGYCYMSSSSDPQFGHKCIHRSADWRDTKDASFATADTRICIQGADYGKAPSKTTSHAVLTGGYVLQRACSESNTTRCYADADCTGTCDAWKGCFGGANDRLPCTTDSDCPEGQCLCWVGSLCAGEPLGDGTPLKSGVCSIAFFGTVEKLATYDPRYVEGRIYYQDNKIDARGNPGCPGYCLRRNGLGYTQDLHRQIFDKAEAHASTPKIIPMLPLMSIREWVEPDQAPYFASSFRNAWQRWLAMHRWTKRYAEAKGWNYIDGWQALSRQCDGHFENCFRDNIHMSRTTDESFHGRAVTIVGEEAVANAIAKVLNGEAGAWGKNDATGEGIAADPRKIPPLMDDFNTNTIADWTNDQDGTLSIVNNRLKFGHTAAANFKARYTADTVNTDDNWQCMTWAEVGGTVSLKDNTGLLLRVQGTPGERYEMQNLCWLSTTQMRFFYCPASGTCTALGTHENLDTAQYCIDGYSMCASVESTGSNIVLKTWLFNPDETPDPRGPAFWGAADFSRTNIGASEQIDTGKTMGLFGFTWASTEEIHMDNWIGGDCKNGVCD